MHDNTAISHQQGVLERRFETICLADDLAPVGDHEVISMDGEAFSPERLYDLIVESNGLRMNFDLSKERVNAHRIMGVIHMLGDFPVNVVISDDSAFFMPANPKSD